jgi:hypothetical protein
MILAGGSSAGICGLGVAKSYSRHFAVAGAGETLATYFLKELTTPKSDISQATAALIYAVKKVKENNGYCGGGTIVKLIRPVPQFIDGGTWSFGKVRNVDQPFVDTIEQKLAQMDDRFKKSRNTQTVSIIKREGTKAWASYRKRIQAEEKARLEKESQVK